MLDLGVRTDYLYSAFKLTVHVDDAGTARQLQGTGFVTKTDVGGVVFVTNRHVVDPAFAGLKKASLQAIEAAGFNYRGEDEDERLSLVAGAPTPVIPVDDAVDIAAIPLSQFEPVAGSATQIDGFVPRELIADDSEFGNDISAGDFICAAGYTRLPELSNDRPLFLVGIVASDPRFPVEMTLKMDRQPDSPIRAILYQSLSRAGMSGAPVFATQRGLKLGGGLTGPPHRELRLIGVNSVTSRKAQDCRCSTRTSRDQVICLKCSRPSHDTKGSSFPSGALP